MQCHKVATVTPTLKHIFDHLTGIYSTDNYYLLSIYSYLALIRCSYSNVTDATVRQCSDIIVELS